MADFVDSTVRDIVSRLEELKLEVTRLEAARTALVGGRHGPVSPSCLRDEPAQVRRLAREGGRLTPLARSPCWQWRSGS